MTSEDATRGGASLFEKSNLNNYENILIMGLVISVCLEEDNIDGNMMEIEKNIKKRIKYFIINNLSGEIPLKQFYKIIEIIDTEMLSLILKKFLNLLIKLSRNQLKTVIQNKRNKINEELLLKFFNENQGNWFKLSDFEEYFGVNKKTAWSYLNIMLKNGLLIHNGKKANKARYCFIERKMGLVKLSRKYITKNIMLPF